MRIFNNWDVVAKGWYIACQSRLLPKGKAKSLEVCGQRIVLFRGQDGIVRALDAYCPHMGTDLGIGWVDGNLIRCTFHQWAFDGEGNCQDIPCQAEIPSKARSQSYATEEKYGFIWVYPDRTAPEGVPEFDDLKGKPIVVLHEMVADLRCHHHLYLINAVDVQHLDTIHKLPEMVLTSCQNPSPTAIDFTFKGTFDPNTFKGKIVGSSYEYTIRYVNGGMGLLTNVKGSGLFPVLHTIFAPVAIAPGKCGIQPIYVTEQKPGVLGWLKTWVSLLISKYVYLHVLLIDREIRVFNNIRFNPKGLLKIDAPVMQFINQINQLPASIWSKSLNNSSINQNETFTKPEYSALSRDEII